MMWSSRKDILVKQRDCSRRPVWPGRGKGEKEKENSEFKTDFQDWHFLKKNKTKLLAGYFFKTETTQYLQQLWMAKISLL